MTQIKNPPVYSLVFCFVFILNFATQTKVHEKTNQKIKQSVFADFQIPRKLPGDSPDNVITLNDDQTEQVEIIMDNEIINGFIGYNLNFKNEQLSRCLIKLKHSFDNCRHYFENNELLGAETTPAFDKLALSLFAGKPFNIQSLTYDDYLLKFVFRYNPNSPSRVRNLNFLHRIFQTLTFDQYPQCMDLLNNVIYLYQRLTKHVNNFGNDYLKNFEQQYLKLFDLKKKLRPFIIKQVMEGENNLQNNHEFIQELESVRSRIMQVNNDISDDCKMFKKIGNPFIMYFYRQIFETYLRPVFFAVSNVQNEVQTFVKIPKNSNSRFVIEQLTLELTIYLNDQAESLCSGFLVKKSNTIKSNNQMEIELTSMHTAYHCFEKFHKNLEQVPTDRIKIEMKNERGITIDPIEMTLDELFVKIGVREVVGGKSEADYCNFKLKNPITIVAKKKTSIWFFPDPITISKFLENKVSMFLSAGYPGLRNYKLKHNADVFKLNGKELLTNRVLTINELVDPDHFSNFFSHNAENNICLLNNQLINCGDESSEVGGIVLPGMSGGPAMILIEEPTVTNIMMVGINSRMQKGLTYVAREYNIDTIQKIRI